MQITMRHTSEYLFPFIIFLIVSSAQPLAAGDAITGDVKLFLHQHNPLELYIRFELREESGADDTKRLLVASSEFTRITENPFPFSLLEFNS